MSLVELPAELLLAIAEHVCWEPEKGWDSRRLVSLGRTCRYVSSSVASFVGSSVGHHEPWPLLSALRTIHDTPSYIHRVRSIAVGMRFHICGAECAREESNCIAPFVARCQHNLVHLDLYKSTNELLFNLASTTDALPRLRFLSVGGDQVSLSIGAVVAVTLHCPSLEFLCLISLQSGDDTMIPKENAPFRLRYLQLDAGYVDAPAFAWLCSSSAGSLERLTIETDSCEDVEDMAWLDTDTAKATLAVLTRLTVRFHTKLCVAHVLGYTPNLTHLTTHVDTLAALHTLPPSLTGLHLDAMYHYPPPDPFAFVPEGRLQHPHQIVTVSLSRSPYLGASSQEIAEACERAGLQFCQ
ncbi:hypothetical protein EXIGLDRAFT_68919 [Exidia glandulosa HHB12029]|uniref:F-box domain-containing protein n=1 Tax=Exidia glandulosa HHB12029 TaxID=1314781 RepID=A0A165I0T7_EXIGL|nr:hypothetical protein EXIGLDRAFT_68919 [Exidia glandulosa HHB12029]